MRHRLQVVLQILLALVACLLGIATNYATSTDHAPWALEVIRRGSVPAIGLLIAAMVVGQVVVYRLENPAPEQTQWPRDRIPYPGLDAYGEDEAAVYFGREAQAAELTRRLHAAAAGSADRFLLLTGASGSGKSSLVRAGSTPWPRPSPWPTAAGNRLVPCCAGCGRGLGVSRQRCRGCAAGSSGGCCS
jgi:hypothetical protein